MPLKFILKHSTVAGSIPPIDYLIPGELSLNAADGTLYFRKINSDGSATVGTIGSAKATSQAFGIVQLANTLDLDSANNLATNVITVATIPIKYYSGGGWAALKLPDPKVFLVNKLSVIIQSQHNHTAGSTSTGVESLVAGISNTVIGHYSTVLGRQNTIAGPPTVPKDRVHVLAVGGQNYIAEDYSVAVGWSNNRSSLDAERDSLITPQNFSNGIYSTALGTHNFSLGHTSLAVGHNNVVSGDRSVALGNWIKIAADDVTEIGHWHRDALVNPRVEYTRTLSAPLTFSAEPGHNNSTLTFTAGALPFSNNVSGIQIGAVISGHSAIQSGTTVTSITSTTVVMSKPATATIDANISIKFTNNADSRSRIAAIRIGRGGGGARLEGLVSWTVQERDTAYAASTPGNNSSGADTASQLMYQGLAFRISTNKSTLYADYCAIGVPGQYTISTFKILSESNFPDYLSTNYKLSMVAGSPSYLQADANLKISANYTISGSGAGLTALNATNVTAGQLSYDRLGFGDTNTTTYPSNAFAVGLDNKIYSASAIAFGKENQIGNTLTAPVTTDYATTPLYAAAVLVYNAAIATAAADTSITVGHKNTIMSYPYSLAVGYGNKIGTAVTAANATSSRARDRIHNVMSLLEKAISDLIAARKDKNLFNEAAEKAVFDLYNELNTIISTAVNVNGANKWPDGKVRAELLTPRDYKDNFENLQYGILDTPPSITNEQIVTILEAFIIKIPSNQPVESLKPISSEFYAIRFDDNTYYSSNAIGTNNIVTGAFSLAVGYANTNNYNYSSTIGFNNTAKIQSLAYGFQNIASGDNSSAIGYGNKASGLYSSAYGSLNNTRAYRIFEFEDTYDVTSASDATIVLKSSTLSKESVLLPGVSISGLNSVAVGYANSASGDISIAIGYSNNLFIDDPINSVAYSGDKNIASFGKRDSSSLLPNTRVSNGAGITTIRYTLKGGTASTAIGYYNNAPGVNATAIGYINNAQFQNSTAIGSSNLCKGYFATAIGYGNKALTNNSLAIGDQNTSAGSQALTVGYKNTIGLNASYSFASGTENDLRYPVSVMLGFKNSNFPYSDMNNFLNGNDTTDILKVDPFIIANVTSEQAVLINDILAIYNKLPAVVQYNLDLSVYARVLAAYNARKKDSDDYDAALAVYNAALRQYNTDIALYDILYIAWQNNPGSAEPSKPVKVMDPGLTKPKDLGDTRSYTADATTTVSRYITFTTPTDSAVVAPPLGSQISGAGIIPGTIIVSSIASSNTTTNTTVVTLTLKTDHSGITSSLYTISYLPETVDLKNYITEDSFLSWPSGPANWKFWNDSGLIIVEPSEGNNWIPTYVSAINIGGGSESSAYAKSQHRSGVGGHNTVLGSYNLSYGSFSSAIGFRNESRGNGSLAIGALNKAYGFESIAIGLRNEILSSAPVYMSLDAVNTIAVGSDNTIAARSNNLIIFGNSNKSQIKTSGDFIRNSLMSGYTNILENVTESVVVGISNKCLTPTKTIQLQQFGTTPIIRNPRTVNCSAYGVNNTAIELNSSAFGYNNIADGIETVAFGCNNSAQADYSVALGWNNNKSNLVDKAPLPTGKFSTAVGILNSAKGIGSTAIGHNNSAGINNNAGIHTTAVGYNNIVVGNRSSAFGNQNIVNSDYSIALGFKNNTYNNSAVITTYSYDATTGVLIAPSPTAPNPVISTQSFPIPADWLYQNHNSIVLGSNNLATANQSIAIGYNNNRAFEKINAENIIMSASGSIGAVISKKIIIDTTQLVRAGALSVALGISNIASGSYSVVIGTDNHVKSTESLGIGRENKLYESAGHSTVIGKKNITTGQYSVLGGFGNENLFYNPQTIGYGVNNKLNAPLSLAIGVGNMAGVPYFNVNFADLNNYIKLRTAHNDLLAKYNTALQQLRNASADEAVGDFQESATAQELFVNYYKILGNDIGNFIDQFHDYFLDDSTLSKLNNFYNLHLDALDFSGQADYVEISKIEQYKLPAAPTGYTYSPNFIGFHVITALKEMSFLKQEQYYYDSDNHSNYVTLYNAGINQLSPEQSVLLNADIASLQAMLTNKLFMNSFNLEMLLQKLSRLSPKVYTTTTANLSALNITLASDDFKAQVRTNITNFLNRLILLGGGSTPSQTEVAFLQKIADFIIGPTTPETKTYRNILIARILPGAVVTFIPGALADLNTGLDIMVRHVLNLAPNVLVSEEQRAAVISDTKSALLIDQSYSATIGYKNICDINALVGSITSTRAGNIKKSVSVPQSARNILLFNDTSGFIVQPNGFVFEGEDPKQTIFIPAGTITTLTTSGNTLAEQYSIVLTTAVPAIVVGNYIYGPGIADGTRCTGISDQQNTRIFTNLKTHNAIIASGTQLMFTNTRFQESYITSIVSNNSITLAHDTRIPVNTTVSIYFYEPSYYTNQSLSINLVTDETLPLNAIAVNTADLGPIITSLQGVEEYIKPSDLIIKFGSLILTSNEFINTENPLSIIHVELGNITILYLSGNLIKPVPKNSVTPIPILFSWLKYSEGTINYRQVTTAQPDDRNKLTFTSAADLSSNMIVEGTNITPNTIITSIDVNANIITLNKPTLAAVTTTSGSIKFVSLSSTTTSITDGSSDWMLQNANIDVAINGGKSLAIGYSNTSSGLSSLTVGSENISKYSQNSAIGYKNLASGTHSNAVGYSNSVDGLHAAAFGSLNRTFGNKSLALGYGNNYIFKKVNSSASLPPERTLLSTAVVNGSVNSIGQNTIRYVISSGVASPDWSLLDYPANTPVSGPGIPAGSYAIAPGASHTLIPGGTLYHATITLNNALTADIPLGSKLTFYRVPLNIRSGEKSLAIGYGNATLGANSYAIGNENRVNARSGDRGIAGIALGTDLSYSTDNTKVFASGAIGYKNNVTSAYSLAIGSNVNINQRGIIEIGNWYNNYTRGAAIRICSDIPEIGTGNADNSVVSWTVRKSDTAPDVMPSYTGPNGLVTHSNDTNNGNDIPTNVANLPGTETYNKLFSSALSFQVTSNGSDLRAYYNDAGTVKRFDLTNNAASAAVTNFAVANINIGVTGGTTSFSGTTTGIKYSDLTGLPTSSAAISLAADGLSIGTNSSSANTTINNKLVLLNGISGVGTGLTALNASNLSSGTVSIDRLPTTLALKTDINSGNIAAALATGSFVIGPNNTTTTTTINNPLILNRGITISGGGNISGDGGGLTNLQNLNLTKVTADRLPIANLPIDVVLTSNINDAIVANNGINRFLLKDGLFIGVTPSGQGVNATNTTINNKLVLINGISGVGTGLTALNAANLIGTINDDRISNNILRSSSLTSAATTAVTSALNSTTLVIGPVTATAANSTTINNKLVLASGISGNGSELTNLNAVNLTGFINIARFPSIATKVTEALLANGLAIGVACGCVRDPLRTTIYNKLELRDGIVGNGSELTSLSAANLAGIIPASVITSSGLLSSTTTTGATFDALLAAVTSTAVTSSTSPLKIGYANTIADPIIANNNLSIVGFQNVVSPEISTSASIFGFNNVIRGDGNNVSVGNLNKLGVTTAGSIVEAQINNTSVFGLSNTVKSSASTAIGNSNDIRYSSAGAMAVGISNIIGEFSPPPNVTSSANNSMAVGKNNSVYSNKSLAIGVQNTINAATSDSESTVIGISNGLTGIKSMCIGHSSNVSASNSVAIGNRLMVTTDNTVEIGVTNSSNNNRLAGIRICGNLPSTGTNSGGSISGGSISGGSISGFVNITVQNRSTAYNNTTDAMMNGSMTFRIQTTLYGPKLWVQYRAEDGNMYERDLGQMSKI